MSARAWLQFFRIHTASAEMGGFGIAAYLAGVHSLALIPVFIFGILVHATGFGENSLVDWLKGYDRVDPAKAHHPLNVGTIRVAMARDVIITLHLVGIAFFTLLLITYRAGANIPSALISIPSFALAILFGNIYNFYGKHNKVLAPVEISLTFSLFTASVYYALGGHTGIVSLLLFLYAFFYVFFQIAQMGEAKELGQVNERNLLRRMGSYVDADGIYHFSRKNHVFMWSLTAVKGAILVALAVIVEGTGFAGVFVSWLIFVVLLSYGLFFMRVRTRQAALRIMGAGEALSYVILVPAIINVAQWPYILLFTLLPMMWFALLNKVTWGTVIAPQV